MERPAKRQRVGSQDEAGIADADSAGRAQSTPRSLSHPISPPQKRSGTLQPGPSTSGEPADKQDGKPSNNIPSPFQLTAIRDLPPEANIDTVTLQDVLGDPLIAECWEFNYLHDIDFLMGAFDEDVRGLVRVHVVHGFWKREDQNRIALHEQAARYKNVTLHTAPMPEMFGTHHSKMLILFRHDDTAQVIIHTANMIPKDWANMTQGWWSSPLLPILPEVEEKLGPFKAGDGAKFKYDLLNYLREYDTRKVTCRALVEKLTKYDFSSIRGALIASVPGRHMAHGGDSLTRWGWAALKQPLAMLPLKGDKTEIVIQISSIATLGPTDSWLRDTLFKALGYATNPSIQKPDFKVVFPTPDEIRRSLEGYVSGASIHTKIQSAQQVKQLAYLTPIFHHWANDAPKGAKLAEDAAMRDAGRKRAAPHIKTYIRYSGSGAIDWALLTSANLSKQAWGEAPSSYGLFRVASWEIGVMVWPSLFAEDAEMRPTFGSDGHPPPLDGQDDGGRPPVVGLRLPYNLPLQGYGKREKPWVATASYAEPDWQGRVWQV